MHRSRLLALCVGATLVVTLAASAPARACASCACGTAAPMAPGLDVPFAGRLRVGLLLDGAAVEDDHNEVIASQARLGVWWAPASSVVLDLAVPVGARLRLDSHDGHDSGHSAHLGDIGAGARFVLFRDRAFGPRHVGSLRVGLTAPTAPELFSAHPTSETAARKAPALAPELQPGRGAWIPRAELSWLSIPTPAVQLLAVVAAEAPMLALRALKPAPAAEATMVLQWTPTPAGQGLRAGARLGASGRMVGAEQRGTRSAPAGQRGTVFALAGVVVEPTTDVLVVLDVGVPVVSAPFDGGVAHDRALTSLSLVWDLPAFGS